MLHHLDILRPKTKNPGNSTWYFSWSPLEIPSWFKLTPEKSTCYFFNTPGNSISSNLRKHFLFLDPFMQKLLFDKNHWFQLLSTENYWSISLFLISIILHISQPFHHVCCWQRNKMAFDVVRWKLYCYSSPSHLTQENFVSPSTSFLSFFLSFFLPFSFFGLLRSLLQICHQIHQKVLTKSP